MAPTSPALAPRLLLVEDETLFAQAVMRRVARAGWQSRLAASLAQARAALAAETPDLVLLDLRLPDGNGLDLLPALRALADHPPPVVVLTAHAEVRDAVAAMKQGAADYLRKPVDLDELVLALERVLEAERLRDRLDYSRQRETHAVEGAALLGESQPMLRLREQLLRVAELTSLAQDDPPNVLILGETGSGKDVAARLLHLSGRRRERPFVQVDCAALPRDLMEAELFGHERGSFTGATQSRAGLIEAAEGGTVFLDEIGELPLDLQAKLLHVLERRRVRRLGSAREHAVAACFVAATNRDLRDLCARGAFRADLYYRLNVLSLWMPPLRECSEDVAPLATHFAQRTARRYGLREAPFNSAAMAAMAAYPWPGNVRELRHLVERAVMLCAGRSVEPGDLGLAGTPGPTAAPESAQVLDALTGLTLDQAERLLMERVLAQTQGNVSEAARRLGVSRMTLRYRMEKHQLRGAGSE